MAEVLDRVKRHFGAHAVILNTRTLTRGGVLGLGSKPYVEITAAREMADLPAPLRRARLQPQSRRTPIAEAVPEPVSVPPAQPALSDALLAEVGALKALVSGLVCETRRSRMTEVPGELHDSYFKLVQNAVAEEVAQQLIERVRLALSEEQLRDSSIVRERLSEAIAAMLPTAGAIELPRGNGPKLIALVGPTGVGKTTTIAKLAASFCLREQRRVGLITIDTYRIAAVEQLRTYADIIDVPLDVVMRPSEFKEAVTRMSDRDVIFVDTAGRSQRDTVKLNELKAFFAAATPDEVHLVLSSTCGEAVLLDAMARFAALNVTRVIFTKLDEAIGFGVMLACLRKTKARLSYVTTGQDVPDDIRVGEGKTLARLILGDRSSKANEASTSGAN